MILVIDNYDSFVHNLARQIRLLGLETRVVRNDDMDAEQILAIRPRAIVLSPGPCAPDQAGICLQLARMAPGRVPLLGVCLGHQVICQALGGEIVRAQRPVHGQSSLLSHENGSLFRGLPSPLKVGRYHSLVAKNGSLPDCLVPVAWTDDGTIMAVAHREFPVVGVQFHPESILTGSGPAMLGNFFQQAGLEIFPREHREVSPDVPGNPSAGPSPGVAS